MANALVDPWIFPSINNIGGGKKANEDNFGAAFGYITGDCVLVPPLMEGSGRFLTIDSGVYIVDGRLIAQDPNVGAWLELPEPPLSLTYYVFVQLTRDGLGNATGAQFVYQTEKAIDDGVLIAKVYVEDEAGVIIDVLGSAAGSAWTPTYTYTDDTGRSYYSIGGKELATADLVRANMAPSDTVLCSYHPAMFVEAVDYRAVKSVKVPNGGRYRIKIAMDGAASTGTITFKADTLITAGTATADIAALSTNLSFDSPYMVAGDTLTITAKLSSASDDARLIDVVELCGDPVNIPYDFA